MGMSGTVASASISVLSPPKSVASVERGLTALKNARQLTGQALALVNATRTGAAFTSTAKRTLTGRSFRLPIKVLESEPRGFFRSVTGSSSSPSLLILMVIQVKFSCLFIFELLKNKSIHRDYGSGTERSFSRRQIQIEL